MLQRYATATGSSTLITLCLLFLMQFLISLNASSPPVRETFEFRPFVAPAKPDSPLITDTPFEKEKLTVVESPPPRPGQQYNTNGPRVTVRPPQAPGNPGLPVFGLEDGPLVAMVRVAPVYPARMAARGIEGTVLLQFDVSPDGRATNPVVIESSHQGFEAAAIKAIWQFKFKPRIVDGVAEPTYGVRNLFRFNLND